CVGVVMFPWVPAVRRLVVAADNSTCCRPVCTDEGTAHGYAVFHPARPFLHWHNPSWTRALVATRRKGALCAAVAYGDCKASAVTRHRDAKNRATRQDARQCCRSLPSPFPVGPVTYAQHTGRASGNVFCRPS